jgi:hypothetical protein
MNKEPLTHVVRMFDQSFTIAFFQAEYGNSDIDHFTPIAGTNVSLADHQDLQVEIEHSADLQP